jgi:hypothetical protein
MTCHISLEISWQGLKTCFRPHLNWRFAQKIMGLQSHESPNFENFRTPHLGVLGQNDIWVLASWPCTKNTIRGRWRLPPSLGRCESCEFVFAHVLSVHQKCSNYALISLLFKLGRSMWVIDLLVIHHSPHHGALAHPSTLEVFRAKECTLTLYLSVVFIFGLAFEFIIEFGGASRVANLY